MNKVLKKREASFQAWLIGPTWWWAGKEAALWEMEARPLGRDGLEEIGWIQGKMGQKSTQVRATVPQGRASSSPITSNSESQEHLSTIHEGTSGLFLRFCT